MVVKIMPECLFISFFVILVLGVPIPVTLVLASAMAMWGFSNFSLDVIVQKLFSASHSFPLVAIPFFVLAGNIMGKGGMSDRLIKLSLSMVGNVRGGLAMVSVIACMFFASISGSTAATTAAIGIVLVPGCLQRCQDKDGRSDYTSPPLFIGYDFCFVVGNVLARIISMASNHMHKLIMLWSLESVFRYD